MPICSQKPCRSTNRNWSTASAPLRQRRDVERVLGVRAHPPLEREHLVVGRRRGRGDRLGERAHAVGRHRRRARTARQMSAGHASRRRDDAQRRGGRERPLAHDRVDAARRRARTPARSEPSGSWKTRAVGEVELRRAGWRRRSRSVPAARGSRSARARRRRARSAPGRRAGTRGMPIGCRPRIRRGRSSATRPDPTVPGVEGLAAPEVRAPTRAPASPACCRAGRGVTVSSRFEKPK